MNISVPTTILTFEVEKAKYIYGWFGDCLDLFDNHHVVSKQIVATM